MYKFFTVKEANAILPQIKVLVEEIAEKRDEIYYNIARYEELADSEEKTDKEDLEMMYAKSMVMMLESEIKEIIETIQNFGVLVKGIDPVIVDFPSKNDEEDIFLCWKEDEEEIMYWHGINEGFKGRKPISLLKNPPRRSFYNF
ncbi:DUF2203 domain-containing protein [Sulfurihydrogenibium azorense]|jgi:hypothetical protein|uniref:DUF2203 domain-containing protein n=1 Tax=Sulfurihydrogenibium azorense (strain DSM 15241 / OCM 825 / Az-Fu1) TaxID=204536 RepID=C1DUC2_SULAA|nr:DUF2203 domain-containing protein [Sulfurihydrogenibium azorense]ACN98884.1 conserved hypothetical protein [Sulfurihydrogenibium azorense Az-Fu1]